LRVPTEASVRLRRLWDEHRRDAFPAAGTGDARLQEVALYESWLAGIVEPALASGGRLSPAHRRLLEVRRAEADPALWSLSAVLVDLDRRKVLWEKDGHTPRPPASLTKLVTVMVAMDLAGSLDRQVTVPVEATQVESDSTMMGLAAGETVSVRELLYGVFLVS